MTGIIQQMQDVVKTVVGDEKTASDVVYAIIKTFGGERLYVPSKPYQQRNDEIRQLHKAGASIDSLCMRYQLSRQTIYRIIAN
jgi:Mor family transcriptional regulator